MSKRDGFNDDNTIKYNLDLFGIDDMEVVPTVRIIRNDSDLRELIRIEKLEPMKLTRLCADAREIRYSEVDHNRDDWEAVDSIITVSSTTTGSQLGFVDSEGVSYLKEVPDLRTCLGWIVATSIGREGLLIGYELDEEAEKLKKAFRSFGSEEEFNHCLREALRYYDDAYNPVSLSLARNALCEVARREMLCSG